MEISLGHVDDHGLFLGLVRSRACPPGSRSELAHQPAGKDLGQRIEFPLLFLVGPQPPRLEVVHAVADRSLADQHVVVRQPLLTAIFLQDLVKTCHLGTATYTSRPGRSANDDALVRSARKRRPGTRAAF